MDLGNHLIHAVRYLLCALEIFEEGVLDLLAGLFKLRLCFLPDT